MISDFNADDDKYRISKKLKTCSYRYLEHKIKNEYGGGLIMCVEEDPRPKFDKDTRAENECGPSSHVSQADILIGEQGLEPISDSDFDEEDDEVGRRNKTLNEDDDDDDGEEDSLDISDLDEMLNEGLPENYKTVSDAVQEKLKAKRLEKDKDFMELEKVVMDELNPENFHVLPEGWVKLNHETGVPMYIHQASRVVSFAQPYFLGTADLINHRIPLSAIPCLQQKRKSGKLSSHDDDAPTRMIGDMKVPLVKVESVKDARISQSLDPDEVYSYCKDKFNFQMTKTWRKVTEENNSQKPINVCPGLPVGTVLLSFPFFERDGKGNIIRRREWAINPCGKSYVAVLHEFLQQGLKMQPLYVYKELDKEGVNKSQDDDSDDSCCGPNEATTMLEKDKKGLLFESTVILNGEEFGKGKGCSKKEAKLQAAKSTVEILIPELKGKLEDICRGGKAYIASLRENEKTIFDDMKITDPRVVELLSKTSEPSPYSMLLTCLKRNYGTCEVKFKYTISKKRNRYNQYTMLVGKHLVTVNCKNKRDGKQRTAQTILQALHPQLKTWGSLIRLYGNKSIKKSYEKKVEEQRITRLQTKAKLNKPNYAVLSKLKVDLEALNNKMTVIQPIETFVKDDVPNISGVQLNSLDYK